MKIFSSTKWLQTSFYTSIYYTNPCRVYLFRYSVLLFFVSSVDYEKKKSFSFVRARILMSKRNRNYFSCFVLELFLKGILIAMRLLFSLLTKQLYKIHFKRNLFETIKIRHKYLCNCRYLEEIKL
jgi:hypothetical protein